MLLFGDSGEKATPQIDRALQDGQAITSTDGVHSRRARAARYQR
jgi:hypothetical protein